MAALQLYADKDAAIAKLMSDVLKGGLLLSLTPTSAERIKKEVESKGSTAKGKELYLNTKLLACATCHRMEGVGGSTGPDLTRVWDTQTVEKLLESIVDPSKEIKEGYQAYRVATVEGQVLVGLKVSETPKEVVLRDANSRDLRIARDDIESIAPSKLSLMPDNVISQLSYDQFIDLLAFLKSKKEQEALRGLVVEFSVASGYPADLPAKPEVSADPASKIKWQSLFAEPNGTVDLKSATSTSGSPGVYVRTFVFSAKAQSVTGAIQSDSPLKMWVNDKSVLDRTTGNGSSDVPFNASLKAGWNAVLVKLPARARASGLDCASPEPTFEPPAYPRPSRRQRPTAGSRRHLVWSARSASGS